MYSVSFLPKPTQGLCQLEFWLLVVFLGNATWLLVAVLNVLAVCIFLNDETFSYFTNGNANWVCDWDAENQVAVNAYFITALIVHMYYTIIYTRKLTEIATVRIPNMTYLYCYLSIDLCNYMTFCYRYHWIVCIIVII